MTATVARPQLTDTQRTILTLAANGRTSEAIGRTFGVTGACASRHIRIVCDLLGARDRTHAVALALLAGLLDADEIERPVAGAA